MTDEDHVALPVRFLQGASDTVGSAITRNHRGSYSGATTSPAPNNPQPHSAMRRSPILAALRRIGFDPHGGTPEDFTKLLASEMKVWIPVVQATGFQMN